MRRLSLIALALGLLGAGLGLTFAAFSSTTANPSNTFSAKRIFPGTRSVSARDLRDASSGAEVDASDNFSATDARLTNTSNWATTFAANRWIEWDFNSPLPAGLAVSSPQFNFTFASNGAGETSCFYVEVYRTSTSSLIGTHGSSGTPVGCVTGTTQTAFNVAVSEVSTTDIANDLTIRVYGKESNNRPMKIDLATVTGSTPYSNFTLYQKVYRDQADTSLTTTSWGLTTAGDGANYPSAANWATTFSATRYLKLTTSLFLPAGSTVTSASFVYSYRPNTNGDNNCWYFETYNGAALLAAHGSSGTPISCNTSNVTYVTDTTSIPEVDTVAEVNNLVIKVYHKDSGGKKSQTDLARVDVNYYLD